MNKKYIFIGLLCVVLIHYIFYLLGTMQITARFEELEPFKHNLPVYYKGFKLGTTTNIHPGPDYKTTLVDMRIKTKGVKFPANTEVVIRMKDKKEYIELIYPDAPYIEYLKHNAVIDGHLGVNFEHFLRNQAENGGLDEIKENVNNTIKSAGLTFEALTEMINVTTDILKEVQPTFREGVENLNIATKNLADSSFEVRKTLKKGYLDRTLYNIEESSNGLVLTTKNVNGFTADLNSRGVLLTNCLLKNLNIVVSNINEIIVGIGNTLKKKLGGLRLVFGGIDSCYKK